MVSGGRTRKTIEWPTVVVVVVFFAVYLGVILGHRHIPWPVQLVVLVYLGGLSLSIGHELLHGHPTPWAWVNTSVGTIPLSMWIPFGRYKASHIQHHRSNLTDPFDDPESTYLAPPRWQGASGMQRRYMIFLRTTPGRFSIGVPRTLVKFWWRDLQHLRDPKVWRPWLIHIPLTALLAWWLFGVVHYNPSLYLFGFVLGGAACSVMRSFVEHCAVPSGTRSAVVLAGPVTSLLLLNINLHHTHHTQPDVEWYRIPAIHREMGSNEIAAEGAGFYKSYFEVLRTYFFMPFCQPDHPLSPGARPYGSRGLT
jgi:fatty acid desaturase